LRLKYLASILLVLGIVLTIWSYSNLYSWNVSWVKSWSGSIAANSFAETGLNVDFGTDLKKVGVSVENAPGMGWIEHRFEISLLNGEGGSLNFTSGEPPSAGHIFEIPSSWNSLSGVRISNPEGYSVGVNVDIDLHRQLLNSSWQTLMIIGLIVAVAGIVLVALGFLYSPWKTPPPPSNPQ